MKLLPRWKEILQKAWSVRLAAIAGVLTACEVILPLFIHNMPRSIFAVLSMLTITAAMIARIVAQKDMEDK